MEQGVLVRKRTENLEAYDSYLRGVEALGRANAETDQEANVQARQLLAHAVELDSTYADAYAALGHSHFLDGLYGWGPPLAQSLERAGALAQQASAFDSSLSVPHMVLGAVYLWKKQYEQALTEGRQAVALNPNGADSYVSLGGILTFAGQPEEGIGAIETGMRLNPRYRPLYLFQLSVAYRIARRYEEALTPGKKYLTLNPHSFQGHFNLAVIYSELGREEEARAEGAEMLRLWPTFTLEGVRQNLPLKDPAVLERHLAALRKVGLK
jgi:adenylate cyclase